MKKTLITIALLVLVCPQAYKAWKVDNSFYAGYQGLCSYYTTLTPDEKAEYKEIGDYTFKGIFTNKSKWERSFLQNHWSNGGEWSYIVN